MRREAPKRPTRRPPGFSWRAPRFRAPGWSELSAPCSAGYSSGPSSRISAVPPSWRPCPPSSSGSAETATSAPPRSRPCRACFSGSAASDRGVVVGSRRSERVGELGNRLSGWRRSGSEQPLGASGRCPYALLRLWSEERAPPVRVDLAFHQLAGIRRDEVQADRALLVLLRRLLVLHELLRHLLLRIGPRRAQGDERGGRGGREQTCRKELAA